MARDKSLAGNIDFSDPVKYPNGRIRNNDGTDNGTPVNEFVYGDIHEFFAKFMRLSGLQYNNQPDNEQNGYQLVNALLSVAGKNSIVKPVSQVSPSRISVPLKLNILQEGEVLKFRSTFDSVNTIVEIIGSDLTVRPLQINGSFKTGDLIEIINTTVNLIAYGCYNTENIPNLIQRIEDLENTIATNAQKLAVFQPNGAIIPWRKPAVSIPDGWQEVTDFAGKTMFGLDVTQPEFAVLGAAGGSKSKTLNINEIPAHTHEYAKTDQPDNPGNGVNIGYDAVGDDKHLGASLQQTSSKGGGQEFSILNPYRIVNFIEWVGV